MSKKPVDLTPADDRPPARTAVDPDTPGAELIDEAGRPPWAPTDEREALAGAPALEHLEPMAEAEVRSMLENLGAFVGFVLPTADAPDLWHFEGDELDGLTPPLTRVLNKRPAAIQALQRTDELAVAANIGRYAIVRMAYLRQAGDDEAAPEGTDATTGLEGDATPEVFPNA